MCIVVGFLYFLGLPVFNAGLTKICGLTMGVNCADFMVNEIFSSQGTGGATRMDLTVSTFSGYTNLLLILLVCVKVCP